MSQVRRLARLLVGLPSAGLGGAEAQTLALAHDLAEMGVAVVLAAEPHLLPGLAAMGWHGPVQPAPLGWEEGAIAAGVARQAAATAALVAELRPDAALVPLPWPPAGLGIQQALAAAAVPTLVVAHLVPADGARAIIARNGGAPAGPAAYLAVSEPSARRLAEGFGLPADAVGVVENGVVVPRVTAAARAAARQARRAALGLAGAQPLVLFAGRLDEGKGAHLLPGLAEGLAPQGAVVVALGEGALRAALQAHPAARSGLLRLPGHVPDVPDWLLAADVLVLPSRLEGCPLVVLEAFARACPVVASAAALEWLGPAAPTLAIPVPDLTSIALTKAVAARLFSSREGDAMRAAALQWVTSRNRDFMVRGYLGVLRGLMA